MSPTESDLTAVFFYPSLQSPAANAWHLSRGKSVISNLCVEHTPRAGVLAKYLFCFTVTAQNTKYFMIRQVEAISAMFLYVVHMFMEKLCIKFHFIKDNRVLEICLMLL